MLGGGSYRHSASVMTAEIKTGLFEGSHAELGQASAQYGKDNDVQLVGMRDTFVIHRDDGYGLSLSGDAGVLRANLGENNDAGSLGGNGSILTASRSPAYQRADDHAQSSGVFTRPRFTGFKWMYSSFSANSSREKMFRSYPPPRCQNRVDPSEATSCLRMVASR